MRIQTLRSDGSSLQTGACSAVYVLLLLFVVFGRVGVPAQEETAEQPNMVILFVDDMGYGDLSSYGHPTIRTPNLDQLAEQGTRFTSFYTGSWCVPSRTQLLTGRYMPRVAFGGSTGAGGNGGLPEKELTLAEGLKEAGYVTGMAGKWHLGYKNEAFLPPNQGFDSWFGLPYSNDYRKPWVQTDEPLALFRGTEIVEHPINQDTLTTRYTREAIEFINEQADSSSPFFFYLAYNMPHLPLHTAKRFRGASRAGLYADVVETLDWSVGQVLDAIQKQGIKEDTIVFFASDNGPWLDLPDRMLQAGNKRWHAGSAGHLRGHKATSYEGGARVPAMIRWPDHIVSGRSTDEIVASPDIYRTFLHVAGAEEPDHPLDGYNVMPFLAGEQENSPRNRYYYILGNRVEAMRQGPWKLRLAGDGPQLFQLQIDPGERFNRADEKPKLVDRLRKQMKQFSEDIGADLPK